MKTETAMVRSPKVLKPLIEEQVELGVTAGETFFKEAGLMLLEAREGITNDRNWGQYVKTIRMPDGGLITSRQAEGWMRLGRSERLSLGHTSVRSAYGDARTVGRPSRSSTASRTASQPVENKEKSHTEFRARRSAQRAEMLLLVGTGYKQLAQKSHPDTGGSHDAMVLLKECRDILLKYAEGWK